MKNISRNVRLSINVYKLNTQRNALPNSESLILVGNDIIRLEEVLSMFFVDNMKMQNLPHIY